MHHANACEIFQDRGSVCVEFAEQVTGFYYDENINACVSKTMEGIDHNGGDQRFTVFAKMCSVVENLKWLNI
jgi:hypothetical protein